MILSLSRYLAVMGVWLFSTIAAAEPYSITVRVPGMVPGPSPEEIMCLQEDIEIVEQVVTRTETVIEYDTVTETVVVEREVSHPAVERYNRSSGSQAFVSHSRNMNNQGLVGFTRYWWGDQVLKSGYACCDNSVRISTLLPPPDGYSVGRKRASVNGIDYYSIRRDAYISTVYETETVTRQVPVETTVDVEEIVQVEQKTPQYDWCVEQGYPTRA